MDGWIKLHRNILKNKVFQNPSLLKLFLYCLCKAGHDEHDWKDIQHLETIHLMPGEFITSYTAISIDMGITRGTAHKWVKQLEKDGCITATGNTYYTKISLINWALYQVDDESWKHKRNTSETQAKHKRNAKCTQSRIIKNDKNDKERKEGISPFGNGDFG